MLLVFIRRAARNCSGTKIGALIPVLQLAAGAIGGAASSLVRVPTEVVKQRMQTGQFISAPDAVRLIVSNEGFRGLYAGYGSFLLRDLSFDTLQFCIYEQLGIGYKLAHKCDLIKMSYGEPTPLLDYGRFVDLVNEAVNKRRLIFVSSAGNRWPALSTIGAPGGTSSTFICVGVYVSPAMAAGAHSVVEPPSEGLEYT